MLKYLWEDLKPLVLTKLEYQDFKLESFDQMVKKVINGEDKLALWPCTSTKEIDLNYSQDNKPVNSTVAKSQGSAIKNPQVEKLKDRDAKSLSNPQRSEFFEKARKKKKKEHVAKAESVKKAPLRLLK